MYFCVSSFRSAACLIVLVLHLSCFTENTSAAELAFSFKPIKNVGLSATVSPDQTILSKLPLVNDQVETKETVSQPGISFNLGGQPIIEKLPTAEVSVNLGNEQANVKLPSLFDNPLKLDKNVELSAKVSPDQTILTKLPLVLDQIETKETVSQPKISLNLGAQPIIEKLPTAEVSVNLGGEQANVKLPSLFDNPLKLDKNVELSAKVSPDQTILTKLPLVLDQIETKETVSQPKISLNLGAQPIIEKLPTAEVSVNLGGEQANVKLPSLLDNPLKLDKNVELSAKVPSDQTIFFTKMPLELDQIEAKKNVSQPEISLNLGAQPIIEKLPTAEVSVKLGGELAIEKLPSLFDNPLNLTKSNEDEQSQTEVSYDVNDQSNTEKPDLNVSYNVKSEPTTTTTEPTESTSNANKVTEKQWIQRIQNAKSRSLALPLQNTTNKISTGKPILLGQIISNVLYGAPWLAPQTNSKCAKDMMLYNMHLQNLTLWAFKMLDATSKGPEGLVDANTFSFGNFDQCIESKSKILGISGGYTLVDIDFRPSYQLYPGFYDNDHSKDYEPFDQDKTTFEILKHNVQEAYVQRHKFQWGVCLPDTCQSEDVQKIVSNVLIPELNRHGLEGNVTIDPLLHTSKENVYKFTAGFFFVCAMYVLIGLLVIVGTLYDFIYLQYRPKSEHGPMKKFMKPFSLISNFERLMKPSETEEFSIINGFKVCAILQVIIGHRWFIELGNPQSNPNFTHWMIHNFWLGYFKCTIFLETFFVISGFLTFYLITKQLTEKKHLNFIPIMIYRWLRIFPVYGTLIVTYIFVLPYLNSGPLWRMIVYRESERCKVNWWTNVLFINNYVHTDELCIIPSWYLACDMHFFIVGTLLTYAIWKWRKQGLVILGACLTLSTVIPAYIIINENQRGTADITPQNLKDLSKERFYTEVYIKSHMRSMTYFVGILAGYVYMRLKEADYKLSLKSRIFWAPVVLMIGNVIYLSSGTFFTLKHQYVNYEHAIYFTIGRLVWSILISYGIIGHGLSGFGVCISGFLGHRVFHVLGKLVFCVYMYQEIIQLQTIGAIETPTYQSLTLIFWRFCGDATVAFMYAFAINVMIESPFDRFQKNVMKLFVGDAFSKPKPQQSINKNSSEIYEVYEVEVQVIEQA
ncbi:nose resistant to fluoxetine protein 6-like isoform X2 [Aphis gossypii]|uniref:nose resistant to fluoxetine protein 6-like isoform X2 n=1 Tax=Aphis gossypii TaxID=80765 RepID=UPI002158F26F|nr:nose resistant to fluoxetine protein 6-like isoform X2 [Aphis gossypii]